MKKNIILLILEDSPFGIKKNWWDLKFPSGINLVFLNWTEPCEQKGSSTTRKCVKLTIVEDKTKHSDIIYDDLLFVW